MPGVEEFGGIVLALNLRGDSENFNAGIAPSRNAAHGQKLLTSLKISTICFHLRQTDGYAEDTCDAWPESQPFG
jgi:hypothetical protein